MIRINSTCFLNRIFNEFTGYPVNMGNFDDRLILQKIVYALKTALKNQGIDVGYSDYNWHVKGPYSPALANDAFSLFSNKTSMSEKIDPQILKCISDIKHKFSDKIDDVSLLELHSSLLYLINNKFPPGQININDIISGLRLRKPWYDEKTVQKEVRAIFESKLYFTDKELANT